MIFLPRKKINKGKREGGREKRREKEKGKRGGKKGKGKGKGRKGLIFFPRERRRERFDFSSQEEN